MPSIRCLSRLTAIGGALLAVLAATGCTPSATRPLPAPIDTGTASPPADAVPVVRYGRYTLVELVPSAAQRDLMEQVVDVTIPDTRTATVGDALRHVLARSGYRLCAGPGIAPLNSLSLPAAHYRLGPISLRDALLTLAGPAWNLQVDDGARLVCFTRATAPSAAPVPTDAGRTGTVERHPLAGPSLP